VHYNTSFIIVGDFVLRITGGFRVTASFSRHTPKIPRHSGEKQRCYFQCENTLKRAENRFTAAGRNSFQLCRGNAQSVDRM